MRLITFALLLTCLFVNCAHLRAADENDTTVRIGQNINFASKLLAHLGQGDAMLDLMPGLKSELKMWPLGDGILIASYSVEKGEILGLTYWLADERPKSTRKVFTINILSYNPITGELKASIPNAQQKISSP